MKKFLILAVMLVPLVLATHALGQANATLSGTIQDATQAVLPGVTVTATNNETGVSRTAVSNAAGVYAFPGLQVGTYKCRRGNVRFPDTYLHGRDCGKCRTGPFEFHSRRPKAGAAD